MPLIAQIKVLRFFSKYEPEYSSTSRENPITGQEIIVVKPTGNLREIHYVEYAPLGSDKSVMQEKVARILSVDPSGNTASEIAQARANVIAPLYQKWLKGQEPTADGTPLAAWSGVSPEQADTLRARGITTVEELAALNDSHFQSIGISGLRSIVENARLFLSTLDNSRVAQELALKDSQIMALMETVAEMKASIATLQGREGGAPVLSDADYDDPDFVDPRAGEQVAEEVVFEGIEGFGDQTPEAPARGRGRPRKSA